MRALYVDARASDDGGARAFAPRAAPVHLARRAHLRRLRTRTPHKLLPSSSRAFLVLSRLTRDGVL